MIGGKLIGSSVYRNNDSTSKKKLTEKSTVSLDWGGTVTSFESEKPLSFWIDSEMVVEKSESDIKFTE